MTAPTRPIRRIATALAGLGLIAMLLSAAPASADNFSPGTGWAVSSAAYPTYLAPGSSGKVQIAFLNTGKALSKGPITVTDTLPAGLTATKAGGVGVGGYVLSPEEEELEFGNARWNCIGTTTVTCVSDPVALPHVPVGSPYPEIEERIGIEVEVEPGASEGVFPNPVSVSGGGASNPTAIANPITISSTEPGFGFSDWNVWFNNADGSIDTQAGSHPYAMTVSFGYNELRKQANQTRLAGGEVRDSAVDLPPGFLGNPSALPRCTRAQLDGQHCPTSTQVGVEMAGLASESGNGPGTFEDLGLYNMVPPRGVPAEFAFSIAGIHVFLDGELREDGGYALGIRANNTPRVNLVQNIITLWGVPADASHDSQRGSSGICELPGGCPAGVEPKALLTLPTSCAGPQPFTFHILSTWQDPTIKADSTVLTHDSESNSIGFDGCERLAFNPSIEAAPSTTVGESGSGFDFNLDFSDKGLITPNGLAQSQVKKAIVTLPEGITINPSIGEGLGVCTPADIKRETVESVPGEGCPSASKIGTLEASSPLVEDKVQGSIFLAQQDDPGTTTSGAENPFDSLIAFYLVLKSPTLGVIVKKPLKVEPDPRTGQLVATLPDVPQLPFGHFNFHFREGQRAPLITPAACGTYTTKAQFYPWSDPTNPRTVVSSFQITKGVGGGPCPSGGVPPFHPTFQAGATNNAAGSFSPFNMRLIRSDGEQDMTKFSAILPPGELGSLAGVSKCPDSAIDVAKAKTGREEIASPSCPANSLIGHTLAGAGVGEALTYVGGQIYLGGPFHGDPLSVISITPAVAGPFDAGTVVVRLALTLNPKTAEVEVDGANSDPIPHILKGIVLKVRDLRVNVDRQNFTLNPTSCDESSAKARLFGAYLDVFNPADDRPVDLSTRYQAADCANLGYKPGLDLQLKGGTKRGGHPGLLATYKPRKGDANTKGLVVRLPRSAFLDQAHIRTICTRVQFAAKSCPPGAQYGFIKAWTPLLDTPLEGPVWLRSSNHKLPDLVFDLHGLVDIEVSTRIDSAKGGIRASLENLPDAPLSKVLLQMQGGKKGLIVNSRNLCGATSKANVEYVGQNGKESKANPVMQADCGGKRKHKQHHR